MLVSLSVTVLNLIHFFLLFCFHSGPGVPVKRIFQIHRQIFFCFSFLFFLFFVFPLPCCCCCCFVIIYWRLRFPLADQFRQPRINSNQKELFLFRFFSFSLTTHKTSLLDIKLKYSSYYVLFFFVFVWFFYFHHIFF